MDINISIQQKILIVPQLNFDEWMKNDINMTLWLYS
jgi:hypothetical protein